MSKLTNLRLACMVVMALLCAVCASAFSPSRYATNSRLATGKWVKISITESGVYEITYDELREMGFNNPNQVKVYGSGGNRISELLSGNAPDDLSAVPILRTGDKICFYGKGPISMSIADYTTTPHYTRDFNPYSQVGCYFLSENADADVTPTRKSVVTVSNYINRPYCLSYFMHENEQVSVSSSGKQMLGEDFLTGSLRIDYNLPNLADSTIVVHTCLAANATEITYANGVLYSGGATDTTKYTISASRIYVPTNSTVYYNYASPFAELKLTHPAEQGQFKPFLKFTSDEGDASMGRLDFLILSYKRYNILSEENDNQLMMGYGTTYGNERFQFPDASSDMVVWSITSKGVPQVVYLNDYNDASGKGRYFFAPGASSSIYWAFDPTKTLKKISSYENVANQNLHAMSVPDMLIITDTAFIDQAQRIADMHMAVDGISVAVVEHHKIFNEFSSGTRDGMAYRLLCKMLYDRDPVKFKYLLLFGPGSYDNRELMGKHESTLLTYQSDNSNYEESSFTTDDFFGFLEDNSGSNITGDRLTIGVGRITCANVDEAKSDVDKLIEYYTNPDYGVWRNNNMIIADAPDGGMYTFQGEGYKLMLEDELAPGMHENTVYVSEYARSVAEPNTDFQRKTATDAKVRLSNMFKDGQYFATYVGHAGPIAFTKYNHLWVTGDVVRTTYPHLPIMSTACCDAAHYDGDSRGIAELMFHKRDGGAIALFTSSRMVYASGNDMWNKFLIRGFFNYNETTGMPTLGDAYKASKLGFVGATANKLSLYLLGDPAMKLNYPLPRFNITAVNGVALTDSTAMAQISPLQQVTVTAQVVDADGNLDTSFNGDATITLYDSERKFTSLTFSVNSVATPRDIMFPREKLAEVSGRVTNGVFNGVFIVPKAPVAKNETVLLRVYAHKDNSDKMVNGYTKQITMLPYDENVAITDDQAPVISTMYVNNEAAFDAGNAVGTESMLYITATDDQGINMQPNSVDNTMRLVLDEGKTSYGEITCYATSQDFGKVVNIEFPVANLSDGLHTLTFTVYDMMGNSATRTISFMVGQTGQVELVADALPAYLDGEVNFDLDTELAQTPEVIVRVTDATGKLVWKQTASSFPITWDLKDMDGNKVPAGLYRYFGTYNDGNNHGGTSINKLIVLDPLKVAQAN